MTTKNLQILPSTMERSVAELPDIVLKNMYIEMSGVVTDTSASLLSRPALAKIAEVGEGPIRKVFSEQGVFNDDLFVVSGAELYRVDRHTLVATLIGDLSSGATGSVSMAVTAPVGDVPAHLYIAEGGVLWLYTASAGARGQLQVTGAIADGDHVTIDDVRYQWTTGSVDAGTPDGTTSNPWLLNFTNVPVADLQVLFDAINDFGIAGTDYSSDLVEHPTVSATAVVDSDLYVMFDEAGVAGNTAVLASSGAGISWTAGTLDDGGSPSLLQVQMPNDLGAISLAHINSYVIVVCTQDEDNATNGRFYWIEPGEIEVDPLNFATAERSPDKVHQVIVFSNMFWLLGEKTTEPWITTGSPDAPMERFQGILFDRGSWAGTAVQVKGSLIVVDEDGGVFQISGGGEKRISKPQVEEKIRKAIQAANQVLVF